jgi:hypothetical protein
MGAARRRFPSIAVTRTSTRHNGGVVRQRATRFSGYLIKHTIADALNRGFYCPKARIQLLELTRFSKQSAVGYTRLVTITTDNLMQSNGLRLGVGADWTFLHDTERKIQKDLDIAEYTDPHNNPMIPRRFGLSAADPSW